MRSQEGYVDMGNYRLYYQTYGAGFPILLLHGANTCLQFMNHSATWELGKWLVDQGFRAVAFDQHGYGRSSHLSDWPLDYFNKNTEDAVRLLDHLKIKSFGVIGVSEGATVALNLAIRYPERVELVVADSGSYYFTEEMLAVEEDPDNTWPEPWQCLLNEVHGEDYAAELQVARREMLGRLAENKIDLFQGRLAEIKCPTFLAACTGDIYGLNRQTREMGEIIQNAKVKIFRGGDHPVMWNQTDQFSLELKEFLIRILKTP
jgi:pimeloyl-ACP methyl ester carboxylesterase